ncbi:ion channel [Francisella tularensis]|uniref:ion channel n=1 Tax=Francisella tularensis TaxID=263 RepID=UPI000173E3D4|nr:ion channel [Francisella tularensis]ACD31054.1 potassium channel protein [Francisella tularensis subsp. mediasiatica FSC147]MDN9003961.1 ion channel [Francisella tularensis subsp. mediasiatica]WKL73570.1 ion channel [Francisella tularensis subsp. mediasiatica]WKL75634.1 ion channel [Francisella tularensis subsp. mediasiatica]WKL78137.1 ion channel [Francisella tularensis subsp. mediasiatica]
MTIREKYSNYIPLFVSVTMTLNGIITILAVAIPIINKIFSININAEIPSDVYSISMKYNSGLGVIIPLVLGYFMIIIAKGIYQRKRTFWFLAVIFISLSMIGDYIQDKHIAYKITFITHAVEIILLFYFRKAFNKKNNKNLSFYQFVVVTFLLAISYSVLGLYYLRDEFDGIKNISDAVYFTIVTFSTVGYGDIHPITEEAKLFTISIMIVGIGLFATIITVLAGSIINKVTDKFKQKNGVSYMKDHMIICGYTEITKCLIKDYLNSHIDNLIVIEKNYQQKFINIDEEQKKHFIDAESHDYDALIKANISKAKSIFILNEKDSDNILTLLAIKEVLKKDNSNINQPKISIKLDKDESINIANNIGVDQIVSPTKKIAEMLIKYQ